MTLSRKPDRDLFHRADIPVKDTLESRKRGKQQSSTSDGTSSGFFDWCAPSWERLRRAGLIRQLPQPDLEHNTQGSCQEKYQESYQGKGTETSEGEVIDLSTNDYLGAATDPDICAAATSALARWGTGGRASRLVAYDSVTLHHHFEEEIANFCGAPAALVFSSGYLANLGILTTLVRGNVAILLDAHAHASLVDGARASRADIVSIKHNDCGHIRSELEARAGQQTCIIVIESVYSVDGDTSSVAEIAMMARQYQCALIIDDSHGMGITGAQGRGVLDRWQLHDELDSIIVTFSLGKAFGTQGGIVLCSKPVQRYLVSACREFIFDTAPPPANIAAAQCVIRKLLSGEFQAHRVLKLREYLKNALKDLTDELSQASPLEVSTDLGVSAESAIISLPVSSAKRAVSIAEKLRSQSVIVGCFRPPSVPNNVSRIRLSLSRRHTEKALDTAVKVLRSTFAGEGLASDALGSEGCGGEGK